MAVIDHGQMQKEAGVERGGGEYSETNGQKRGWYNLIMSFMSNLNPRPLPNTEFLIKGEIAEFIFDNGKYFTEEQTIKDGPRKGQKKTRSYVKILGRITEPSVVAGDPRDEEFALEFPPKKTTVSFFNGVTKRGRTNNTGGMFDVHFAVTHEEPSQELQDGYGRWDTDDYVNKPVLLRILYMGKTQEDSPYFNRRGKRTFYLNGFERDPDFAPEGQREVVDDLDLEEPELETVEDIVESVPTGAAPSASTPVAETPVASASPGKSTRKTKKVVEPAVTPTATADLTAEWDDEEV